MVPLFPPRATSWSSDLLVVLLARHARRARAALEVRLPVAPGWAMAAKSATSSKHTERRRGPLFRIRAVWRRALLLGPQGSPAQVDGAPEAGGWPHGLLRARAL